MKDILRKIYDLTPRAQRKQAVILMAVMLFIAVLQMGAVTSIMPFMAVVSDPGIVERNEQLNWFYELTGLDRNGFLILLGFLVLGMIVVSNGARAVGIWMTNRFIWSVNTKLSRDLLDRYLHRPYLWFVQHGGSEPAKNILLEVENFSRNFLQPILELVAKGVTALLLIGLIVVVDWKVALVAGLGLGGVYTFLYLFLRRRLERLGQKTVDLRRVRYKTVQEGFDAMKEAKAFGREGYFVDAYDDPTIRYSRAMVRFNLIRALPQYFLETIAFGGLVLLVVYFISTADNFGRMVPIISLYGFAAYRLLPAIQGCFRSVSAIRFTRFLVGKLHDDFFNTDADCDIRYKDAVRSDSEPEFDKLPFEDRMELENVTFAYPGGQRPAVRNVSVSIPRRTMVAFCGPTGSGKTTLVDLILGLFLPDSGRILVDGKPLSEEILPSWRRNVGYVSQNIFLSDSTIAHNIAFGRPLKEIDMEAVRNAARMAQVADFIENELPEQYETVVGERGVRLSGGQRQRLGIARALYHDPDVLIFDEATSALDGSTERNVMEAIGETAKIKTVILIAHRLTTVQQCDRIFVMEHGNLVEQGRYEELVNLEGAFSTMASGS